eukprot:scaffold5831_cov40-Cyclotella_meneghiniana.AAC.4
MQKIKMLPLVAILVLLHISPAISHDSNETSHPIRHLSKSKSGKTTKCSKASKISKPMCLKCTEYCDLLNAAKVRCPYSSHIDEDASCLENCMNANFSKNGSDQDFMLKDTLQYMMNHAKMAIKEGALTNSNHCLHASIPGPERCVKDEASLALSATLTAGKYYFYSITTALQGAGTDMSKIFQVYFAIVQYLLSLRGRLYVSYPYLADEDEYSTVTTDKKKYGAMFNKR